MASGRSPRGGRHVLLLAALALLPAGCNAEAGSADGARDVALPAGVEPSPVTAIEVNPADGAVFLSTATGALRVAAGERAARPLKGTFIGTRGGQPLDPELVFTFVGPDHLLGSGRVSSGSRGSPDLGLIESTDGGRTWSTIAYRGEADLHLISARGPGLTAYDRTAARLLSTVDRGQTWRASPAPGVLSDMAVDPTDARHLIAVGETGILETRDRGAAWRPAAGDADLLAWPSARHLVMVDREGTVSVSDDAGTSSRAVGSLGGRPQALTAQDDRRLWAATERGVLFSGDGGSTWRERFRLVAAAG